MARWRRSSTASCARAAGSGGTGAHRCTARSFKPLGGPDGGNGGRGGDVVLEVDTSTTTLLDYHHAPHRRATNGKQGAGGHRNGGDGEDLVLSVPEGTTVRNGDGEIIADLVVAGHAHRGGRRWPWGPGQRSARQRPSQGPGLRPAGEPGEAGMWLLELRSLSRTSPSSATPAPASRAWSARCRPPSRRSADYPFTTLVPNHRRGDGR